MWVEPIKNTFQSMLMLWVKGEKKVKEEGKRGNKGILKYLNGLFWIITPLEKKKKINTLFWLHFLVFRRTSNCAKLLFLYSITYFALFIVVPFLQQMKKIATVPFFATEKTTKKHFGCFFLLIYVVNQPWNWAQFYI